MTTQPETIPLNINAPAFYAKFMREAESNIAQTHARVRQPAGTPDAQLRETEATLKTIRDILVPLQIAAAAMDSPEAVEDFRDRLAAATHKLVEKHDAIQNELEHDYAIGFNSAGYCLVDREDRERRPGYYPTLQEAVNVRDQLES